MVNQRKKNRLSSFDYSSAGHYFVTICTKDRKEYFGDVKERKIVLNEIGIIAERLWQEITKHFNNVGLDEFIVMSNHLHGIIVINTVGAIFKSPNNAGEINFAPTKSNPTISTMIKWFKSISSIHIRKTIRTFQWQRSFYDHVIRNERSLLNIREYIKNNPLKWDDDPENPHRNNQ